MPVKQYSFNNYSLLVGLLLLFATSCNVTRNLNDDQSLLVKNKLVIQNKLPASDRDKLREDLQNIIAQKPNRRLFGFMPTRMWLYVAATRPKKKLTKFRQWIIDKVGEPPAIYDPILAERSEKLLENYLFNFGYFYADVQDTVVIKNKRSKAYYNINTGEPWKFGTITYPSGNTKADSLVKRLETSSLLRKDQRFTISTLKEERARIEDTLRNNGFYFFSRDYITYNLDTNTVPGRVSIRLFVTPPSDSTQHEQYRINDIYVTTDYIADFASDTLKRDTIQMQEYHFIFNKRRLRQNILLDAITMRRNMYYSKTRELRTINRLAQLGVYKFINVSFEKSNRTDGNYLNGIISLTPAKRQAVSATGELNVTNEGFFGTALSFSYKNKNLSKRADQLLIDLSGGVQLKFSRTDNVEVITSNINTGVTYYLNRLIPFKPKKLSSLATPRTRLNINYNFEYRYDFDTLGKVVFLYQLHNFNFNFGYEWNQSRTRRHLLNPLTVSFFLIPERGDEFNRRLNLNSVLKSSFEEQVILGPNYTFIYNNQRTDKDRVYMYLRANVETAGNILFAGFKLANLKSVNDSLYYIFNRPFSQYFRFEADWRNYFRIRNHGMFAIRTFAGAGLPYGNGYALPFIKQFFVGGPNSLRGFLIREIGPGGYVNPAVYNPETGEKKSIGFFNQTGDIKLEMNAEFRFDIYKWFKGAVFMDAGNVWTFRKDDRLNGEFNIKRFWDEFAVDAGLGARLDFNFFVIRFDYGFPLRDPRKNSSNRWLFENGRFLNGQFQLAIGYPF